MKPSHESIKALLAESITVLCKNGLQYRSKFTVQGLLGITLDDEDVFLVDIHEKVGESISLGHKSVSKRRHRERGLLRAKRRKFGSDISRSSSPEIHLSDSEPASPCSQGDENSFAATKSADNSVSIATTPRANSYKQRTAEADKTTGERPLYPDMGVEHILELSKDLAPWPQASSGDPSVTKTPSETESGERQLQNVSRVNISEEVTDVAAKIVVKRETDDEIVFVKQEKSDITMITQTDHTRTHRPAETFPRHAEGTYQDSDLDSQTDFSSHGFFQNAQAFPPLSDQGFSQESNANMSDLFQKQSAAMLGRFAGETICQTEQEEASQDSQEPHDQMKQAQSEPQFEEAQAGSKRPWKSDDEVLGLLKNLFQQQATLIEENKKFKFKFVELKSVVAKLCTTPRLQAPTCSPLATRLPASPLPIAPLTDLLPEGEGATWLPEQQPGPSGHKTTDAMSVAQPMAPLLKLQDTSLTWSELATLRNNSTSTENFSVVLVRKLFSEEEMRTSNCSGKVPKNFTPKQLLDPARLEKIKQLTMEVCGIPSDRQPATWRSCRNAINEACRRLNRVTTQQSTTKSLPSKSPLNQCI